MNTSLKWLIAYDIANPRRLQRFHRQIAKIAQPMQYSIFLYEGTKAALEDEVMGLARRILDEKEDWVDAHSMPDSTIYWKLSTQAELDFGGLVCDEPKSPTLWGEAVPLRKRRLTLGSAQANRHLNSTPFPSRGERRDQDDTNGM